MKNKKASKEAKNKMSIWNTNIKKKLSTKGQKLMKEVNKNDI